MTRHSQRVATMQKDAPSATAAAAASMAVAAKNRCGEKIRGGGEIVGRDRRVLMRSPPPRRDRPRRDRESTSRNDRAVINVEKFRENAKNAPFLVVAKYVA